MPSHFTTSVIIPVYNAERYLERAVSSALAQPQTGEVILIEDCSPDGSLALCEKLASSHPGKVRLLRHPDGRNHGAGPTRNLGIRAAKHPFIAFLDADDYYLPGRFERDVQILAGDESIDGVYGALGTDFQDEEGRRWWATHGNRGLVTAVRGAPPPEKLFFALSPIGTAGHFSLDALTVRKRVFEKVEFSNLRIGEDTLLIFQLAALYKLVSNRLEKTVAQRGVHGENTISDAHAMRMAELEMWSRLVEWVVRSSLPKDKSTVLHQTSILFTKHWRDLASVLRGRVCILAKPRTWVCLLRWFFIRRYPDDPFIPGLLPHWRRK